jgi:hypothetical protein
VVILGNNAGTPQTGRFSFLLPPTAVRSDATGRQCLGYWWYVLHSTLREATLRAIEMDTPALCADRGESKNLGRLNRAG